MHYTYVLLTGDAGRFYTGYSTDLRKRLKEHAARRVQWTAFRQPVHLAYYEACRSRDDALRRERFLKTGKGKRYLRKRLAAYLGTLSPVPTAWDSKARRRFRKLTPEEVASEQHPLERD
jgi:putative endonuclease